MTVIARISRALENPPGPSMRSRSSPDPVLEIRKGHAKELGGADPKLGARIESGIGSSRHVYEMEDHRL